MKKGLLKFLFISLGFLLGCALSLMILWVSVKTRANYLSQLSGFATPAADVANPDIYKILEQADAAAKNNDTQKVADLILPNIDQWPSAIDKATGYQLLAVSEFNAGNPQKAIPYAKKMVENDHSAFSLLLLAQAYDYSGDLKNALAAYQQILSFSQVDDRVDYNYVRERTTILSQTLGTPIP